MRSADEWAEFHRTATPDETALYERVERLRKARTECRWLARRLLSEELAARRRLDAMVSKRKAGR